MANENHDEQGRFASSGRDKVSAGLRALVKSTSVSGSGAFLQVTAKDASGNEVGRMELQNSGPTFIVRDVTVKDWARGQGHGIAMYEQAISHAKASGAQELTSDKATSVDADRVWQGLVRRGYPAQRAEAVELDKGLNKYYSVKAVQLGNGQTLNLRTGEPVWRLKL